MAEVGAIYVSVMPTTTGISRAISDEIDGGINQGATKGEKSFGGKVGGMVKIVGGAALAVGGLVAGLALKGGFSRALNIEDAQAKLKGLGNDAKTVEQIMADALGAVRGTAFGLDSAATVAASAVAAGIEPGQELEKYLRLTADAATIAGVSLEEMGAIINKTTSSGKVYADNLNQLADRGIPIFQLLADEYGVTTDELSKMVAQGEIDSETFRRVLEENLGGAALASGDTTRGAFANMLASLSRVGANFLSGVFPYFKEGLNGITDLLAPVEAGAKEIGASFGDLLRSGLDLWASFKETGLPELASNMSPLIAILEALAPELKEMGEQAAPVLLKALQDLNPVWIGLLDVIQRIVPELIPLIPVVFELIDALLQLVPPLVELALVVLPPLLQLFSDMPPELFLIVQGSTGLVLAFQALAAAVIFVADYVQGLIDVGRALVGFFTGEFTTVGVIGQLQAVDGPIGTMVDGFLNLGSTISQFVSTAIAQVQSFSSGVAASVGTAVSFFTSIPGRIIGIFSSAGSWLFSAGMNIVQGLINGVQALAGRAISAVLNLGSGMVSAVKSFLGIQSPSRVFRYEVGQMIGEGLVLGIGDSAPNVDASINSLINVPAVLGGGSGAVPDSMTLLDADGSILSHARVIAGDAVSSFDAATDRVGRQGVGRVVRT